MKTITISIEEYEDMKEDIYRLKEALGIGNHSYGEWKFERMKDRASVRCPVCAKQNVLPDYITGETK